MDATLVADAAEALAAIGVSDVPTEAFAAWLHGPPGSRAYDESSGADDAADIATLLDAAREAVDAVSNAAADGGEAATRPFWEAFLSTCPSAAKALIMILFRTVARGKEASAPDDAAAVAGVKAAELYWALLTCPASSAYAIFDATLVRAVVAFSTHFFELVRYTAQPAGGVGRARVKARQRAARNRLEVEPAPAGARRNPSRQRSEQQRSMDLGEEAAAPGDGDGLDAAGDGDASDGGEAECDSEEEDDDVRGAGAAKAGRKRRGRATSTASAAAAACAASAAGAFTPTVAAALGALLGAAAAGLGAFDLRVQPELLTCCTDLFVGAVLLPEHALLAPSAQEQQQRAWSGAAPLTLAARVLLALLRPGHGPPLTSARLAMKRLKPLLMLGTPHATRAPAAPSAAAAAIMEDGGGVGCDDGDQAAPATRPPPPLPDPRAVRARALFLVRCAVTDDERGESPSGCGSAMAAAAVTSAALAASTVVPAPQRLLDRLPAITALMQVRQRGCCPLPHDSFA